MNHAEKLQELISKASTASSNLPSEIGSQVRDVCGHIESQKAVYTVLVTLGVHKLLFPSQDIRYHQDGMPGGFSARTIDAKWITPTLMQEGLPSMQESGWLTRTLEQPHPYSKDYPGRIQKVKTQFLDIVDFFQREPTKAEAVLLAILAEAIKIREEGKIEIMPLADPDKVLIADLLEAIESLMTSDYKAGGVSKVPVIVFHSLYQNLLRETERFKGMTLKELGSHTSPDANSESSGDIEVLHEGRVFEALEIKFDVDVDSHMVNRAIEKIHRHNPKRYYILTTGEIADHAAVDSKRIAVQETHGCQLIVNGVMPTLRYWLRLLDDIESFINSLNENLTQDAELKTEHKRKWAQLVKGLEARSA